MLTGRDITHVGEAVTRGFSFDGTAVHVNLLLESFAAQGVFAGITTAVQAAGLIAAETGLRLRVVVFEEAPDTLDEVTGALRGMLGRAGRAAVARDLTVSIHGARDRDGFTADDVWIATFWTTAWALQALIRAGRPVAPERVVYLVQDWEPAFYPWGDLHAKAQSTYRPDFRRLVNSAPLARYVGDVSGRPTDPSGVFAPQVDAAALERAIRGWVPGEPGEVRVLFYARPSKPRNMFALGLQTLRLWADRLPANVRPVVRLAGEQVEPVDLGGRAVVEVLGKTTFEEYYELLGRTDVGLALMHSPHPGHLALELPMVGIPTVTNLFLDYRTSWVDGLILGEPHPDALADALDAAVDLARRTERATAGLRRPTGLGGSLQDAAAAVAARLSR